MMLDLDLDPLREGFVRALPLGLAVAVIMLIEMLSLIGVRTLRVAPSADPAFAAGLSNTAWLANALFSRFLLPFEIAALILTVAIVAAIPLALRPRIGVKSQSVTRQVNVDPRDRVRVVKMRAERPLRGDSDDVAVTPETPKP
jgi:NADH-quinone oxidoreductase subunit J